MNNSSKTKSSSSKNTSKNYTNTSDCSNDNESSIKIRIKPSGNEYKDVTINIPLSYTVHQLKDQIRSSCFHSSNSNTSKNNDDDNSDNCNTDCPTTVISKDRYLRLICSGRLLAPDSTNITDFKCIQDGSVIHAVLAAPGMRGGQQAALARDSSSSSSSRTTLRGGGHRLLQRMRQHSLNQRRQYEGIGIQSNGLIISRRRSNDEDEEDGEDGDIEEGRQRLGFDRLRANGMSRSEIVTIRSYFSEHVDRFIEQRNQINSNNNSNANTSNNTDSNDNNNNSSSNSNSDRNISNNTNNDTNNEDPRIYRLRMEDEWMALQGPYSEFRLNTNTSINMNNNTDIQIMNISNNNNILPLNSSSRTLRSRTYINGLEIDSTTREITRDFRNRNGNSMIGALGTNRDFAWGFVWGYSFGFMTMFVIWLPTVSHKQRVGILSGFCFHMIMKISEEKMV